MRHAQNGFVGAAGNGLGLFEGDMGSGVAGQKHAAKCSSREGRRMNGLQHVCFSR
jgi:hypothetical protein